MSDEPVTQDEVMRVRRHECRLRGHSWDALMRMDREDPTAFICSNCGRRLLVVGDGVNEP